MERWRNKVAVVTGASAGIGAAIVKDLVKANIIVIGMARRVEKIEALKAELPRELRDNLHARQCDVAELQSLNEAFDWVIDKFGGVDILVNNAGVQYSGQLVSFDAEQLQQTVQINLMGAVYGTQRAYASMKQRNFAGHIFMINSVGGHQVFRFGDLPDSNLYCPSKFAMTAATEIYRQELHYLGTKIKITSISPGFVLTDIVPERFVLAGSDSMLHPEDVSQCLMFALATPPHVQIHELIVKPVGETFL